MLLLTMFQFTQNIWGFEYQIGIVEEKHKNKSSGYNTMQLD